jgi:hypothetical protein
LNPNMPLPHQMLHNIIVFLCPRQSIQQHICISTERRFSISITFNGAASI